MKIALTYENGQIFQHFGYNEQFKTYEIQDGTIKNTQIVEKNGSGHGTLAGLISTLGVEVLICVRNTYSVAVKLNIQTVTKPDEFFASSGFSVYT